MKKIFRLLGYLFVFILVLISGVLLYVKLALPSAGPTPYLQVEPTEELIERGRYLANHVSVCVDCHSERDWTRFSGPIKPGTIGKGGEYFGSNIGLPGDFYAANITPYNLENWSDGELYHVITTGINQQGEALFPIMPYQSYSKMDSEDVKAIIAYLRTLSPISSTQPERNVHFPMNFIINTIPKKATPMTKPKPSNTVKYGEYLTTIAACADCHTPQEKGSPIEGMHLAGGFEFPLEGGIVRSVNITPHETGIGNWTRDAFIARFKSYEIPENIPQNLGKNDFNTVMPWTMYAGMSEEDLGAIYDYLRTVKPVSHTVERFTKN